jgi:hypothetical protein
MKHSILILLFITSCWNDPDPEPAYCWKCNYDLILCDFTQTQVDSLIADYQKQGDTLICVKDSTTLNLIIE